MVLQYDLIACTLDIRQRRDAMAAAVPMTVERPEGSPRGGVVLIQEAFGVNEHVKNLAGRLAAAGWYTVAPHLFHRSGSPSFDYGDLASAMAEVGRLTAAEVLEDVDAAFAELRRAGIEGRRTAVIGFCIGGYISLAVAARRPVGAAVSFYGGGITSGRMGFGPLLDEAPKLQSPWLGLYGDEDTMIPVVQVELLREAAASAAQPTEVIRYAGAGHGFHCDERSDYREAPARDGWQRTLEWLEQHATVSRRSP